MAPFAANYTSAELQIASSSPLIAPPKLSPPAAPFAVSKDPIIILIHSSPDNPYTPPAARATAPTTASSSSR